MAVSFGHQTIKKTIDNLINGRDYRTEVLNKINSDFFDFIIKFFKDLCFAKLEYNDCDDWYKRAFILNGELHGSDIAIYSGINKKSIKNIHRCESREIVLDASLNSYDYLSNLIDELNITMEQGLEIELKISYEGVTLELSLKESLLVMNTLATKKLAIRGGAWSSIGKKVEKPLMVTLCELCDVPKSSIDSSIFEPDGSLDFDREVDFKIKRNDGSWLRCEVKLMGQGNPESADVVYARDTNIFVADTLSVHQKNQLDTNGIQWLEMKDHSKEQIITRFSQILEECDVQMEVIDS